MKNTYTVPFANTFQDIEDYIRIMGENGTKPEFEVYEVGMLSNIAYFMNKGMLKGPVYIQLVLGVMGGMPATIDNLLFLYNTARKLLGDEFVWSCAAAGKNQFEITTTAMLLGGNIRVGLEDNLYIAKGVLAKSNAEPVAKVANFARLFDREVASPNGAREILGLK